MTTKLCCSAACDAPRGKTATAVQVGAGHDTSNATWREGTQLASPEVQCEHPSGQLSRGGSARGVGSNAARPQPRC